MPTDRIWESIRSRRMVICNELCFAHGIEVADLLPALEVLVEEGKLEVEWSVHCACGSVVASAATEAEALDELGDLHVCHRCYRDIEDIPATADRWFIPVPEQL